MTKDFKYGQVVHQHEHNYPKTTIKKLYANTGLIVMVDGKDNAIIVQLISPLYKDKNFPINEELDVIQFVVKNTPIDKLNELSGTEIMHLLTESMKIAVDKTNEVLKIKYPKTKTVAYYSREQLKKTWDVTVQQTKKDNPNFLEGTQWGIA